MNNTQSYRVGARVSGEWAPSAKCRSLDDAQAVAKGLINGGVCSAARIWKIGSGNPQLVARVSKQAGWPVVKKV